MLRPGAAPRSSAPASGRDDGPVPDGPELPGGGRAAGAGGHLQHRVHVDGADLVQILAPAHVRGSIVGLFNTACSACAPAAASPWACWARSSACAVSLELSSLMVVLIAIALFAREARVQSRRAATALRAERHSLGRTAPPVDSEFAFPRVWVLLCRRRSRAGRGWDPREHQLKRRALRGGHRKIDLRGWAACTPSEKVREQYRGES